MMGPMYRPAPRIEDDFLTDHEGYLNGAWRRVESANADF